MGRTEVRRLEAAWQSFLRATGPRDIERAAGPAALHLAFREMEDAVCRGKVIPYREELVLRIAHALLGSNYESLADVEATVSAMLAGAASAVNVAEDVISSMSRGSSASLALAPMGSSGGGATSRAASIIGSMLTHEPDSTVPPTAMRA